MSRDCRGLGVWFLILLFGSFPASAGCGADRLRLLPDPVSKGGEDALSYIQVPFAIARFESGSIVATWDDAFAVVKACIAADWEYVSDYTPGSALPLRVDSSKRRYDFVGRFVDRKTGKEFLGTTPIFDREWIEKIAASGDSVGVIELARAKGDAGDPSDVGSACAVTDRAVACDAAVTCTGDGGTCVKCGNADTACCESQTTVTTGTPDRGQVTIVTKTRKTKGCRAD